MTNANTRYLTTAETAREIRVVLKREFAGTKFSVRSSNYSMGSSISISYTDGPTGDAVQDALVSFLTVSFDGMTDSTNYHRKTITSAVVAPGETVEPSASYIMVRRSKTAPQPEESYADRFEALIG